MIEKKPNPSVIGALVFFILLLLLILPGCKKPAKGTIVVRVVDWHQTPVPGVAVTLTSRGSAGKTKKITSAWGICVFSSISPADNYILEAEKSGFFPKIHQGIKVIENQSTSVLMAMAVNTKVLPGRWRIAEDPAKTHQLTPEQIEAKKRLETLSYLPGHQPAPAAKNVTSYDEKKAYNGLNLYCSGHGPEAILMDMKGNQLHKWRYDIARVWQKEYDPLIPEHQFWRRVHLLENGDLLAIFEGYGLIKLDKDSNLIWSYARKAHHDLYVMPDGKIYVLTREANIIPKYNQTEMILEDFISILSPHGKELQRVSLLKCMENSNFASFLDMTAKKGDIFHTNTLEVLDGRLVRRSPAFKQGNVLVSMLELDFIAVVDLEKESLVWGLSGPWKRQHQPTVLDNDHMLIFDNNTGEERQSRVLEFDPFSKKGIGDPNPFTVSQMPFFRGFISKFCGKNKVSEGISKKIYWEYPGAIGISFYSADCGSCQRLGNGNTLISDTNAGRAFEVTPDKTIAWEFYNPHRAGKNNELIASLFEMIRISPGYNLDWLKTPGKNKGF